MVTIYLAGGLFNAGERLHNLYLEKHLKVLGYDIILPQREALKFFDGVNFDVAKIVNDCTVSVTNPQNLYVGQADGADTDSGTSVEYGMAIVATGRAIVCRTDFRTVLEKEVGINAMLTGDGTRFIYFPCYFTDLQEVEPYYANLAQKIHEEILTISM